jgi:hypothetical protein
MAVRTRRLFSSELWIAFFRCMPAYVRAMMAFEQGDFSAALLHFERVIERFPDPDAEYMALYGLLFTLNNRPAEALPILARVGAGHFRFEKAQDRWQYPEAFARYLFAFLTDQPDVVDRWADAVALRPDKGFASKNLKLPDSPLFAPQGSAT